MANITNTQRRATIRSGRDDDVIINRAVLADLRAGAGNDSIYNADYAVRVTMNGGAGDDTIENLASHSFIKGGDGNDTIHNTGKTYVTILGGAGNDTILNYSSRAKIEGDADDDYINSYAGDNITINGGDGNDTIVSNSQRISINGGDGSDIISIVGNSTTVNGGKGNDTITGSSRLVDTFQFSADGGNDVITDYKANDMVQILSGEVKNVTLIGSDLICTVASNLNSGTLTLKNVLNTRVRVLDAKSNITVYDPAVYLAGAAFDTLAGFSLRGGYNEGDNTSLYSGDGDDIMTNRGNVVYIGTGTGNDSINNSGSSVTIKADEYYDDVGIERAYTVSADCDDIINTSGDTVLVYAQEGDDEIYNRRTVYTHSVYVTIYAGTGNDTIQNYGEHAVVNGDEGNDKINNEKHGKSSTISGGEGKDTITNSGAEEVSISGGAGRDSLYSNGQNVTINGGIDNDFIRVSTGKSVVQYASGDGHDTVYGFKISDTLNLTSGTIDRTALNGSDVVLYVGDGTIIMKNYKGKKLAVLDATGNLTREVYSGPQDYNLPSGLLYNNNRTVITATSETTVTSVDLRDTDTFSSKVANVNATDLTNEFSITGNSRANAFKAGSGGGTLDGGLGSDVLYGGSGADVFAYTSQTVQSGERIETVQNCGNDIIYDYTPGQDSILLGSDITVSRVSVLGRVVTLHFDGGGSFKINDGVGKELTITDSSGTTATYTFTKSNDYGLVSSTDITVTSASYQERFWFDEDDNFINTEINIDSLIEDKSTTNNLISNLSLDSPNDLDKFKISNKYQIINNTTRGEGNGK